MKLEGKIETIIYKNETNSWTVLLIKSQNEYITAVGETDNIEVGDEIEFEGIEDTHKVYGKQFKFNSYKKMLPKTSSALIQYISDNIKGIGKKTAKTIVDMFGDETVSVIRFNKSKLEGIKGLNYEKISALSEFFNEEYEKWNCVEYLSDFGISVIIANKIYQVLGQDTIKVINENPYSLLKFVKSLEFKLVDDIGKRIGISSNNEERIDSGMIFAINQITEFGHTCVGKDALIEYAAKILEVDKGDVENAIIRLQISKTLYSQTIDDEEYIFRRSLYIAEENIAKSVVAHTMISSSSIEIENYIKDIEKDTGIVLSSEQKEAINVSLNNHISIITGGPGTGKTTIIKCIIDILELLDKKYVLCAPTGRAAKRITQTTGQEAKTLHRLLEINKVDDRDLDSILETQVKTVEADVVIIDESSMIDTLMMNNLLKGIKIDTKIILVGDINQLPSVGPGSVLKDIIDSQVANVVYLKQIYRQSEQSDIILNAHKVNNGEYPEFKSKDTDMFFINSASTDDVISEISSLLTYRLEGFASIDTLKDLQILTPMKKTELGTIQLNHVIQEILNKHSAEKNEKKFGDRTFREGDKVMQIINNYDKSYLLDGTVNEGIYNGDIGYIEKISNVEEIITIDFDGKKVDYNFDEIEQLEHAYAVTIHKSQGSEFDYVILPIFTGYQRLFTRNLLYTAMTRAKKMLIIIGSKKVLNYMVDNIDSKNRVTGLRQKILRNV